MMSLEKSAVQGQPRRQQTSAQNFRLSLQPFYLVMSNPAGYGDVCGAMSQRREPEVLPAPQAR